MKVKKIVRVAGTNLDGEKPLINALREIKGISFSLAKAICEVSGFDPHRKMGLFEEKEIKKLEEIIYHPEKFDIPNWLLNRRRDRKTGKDLHLVGAELEIAQKFDIQRLINLRAWRGIRHMYGLPVRGQRTRSSFRKGRTVGVVRKGVKIKRGK